MQTDSEKWSYRELKNGDKYTPYFPAANGNSTTRIRNAITDETVELMIRLVKETRNQTAKIAKHPDLIGRNLDETLEKVWNFAYWHIQYKLDKEGVEELRTPARAWKDRKSGIDCDCFSIFISSILFNMGIPHAFRIAKYGGKHWQHVYVIVPTNGGYYTLDAVLHNFNQEKTPTQKKDFHVMNVNVLSGVGDFSGYGDEFDDDLGKTKTPNKLVQKAKGLIKKVIPGKANPAPKASSTPKKPLIKLTPKQQTKVVKIKNTINKVKEKAMSIVKNPGKAIVKYLPIVVLSRNGFYLFLKVFHQKIASKLVPAVAYQSEAEAVNAGISATDYNKAKEAYAKIKALVIDKLQGDETVLKKAILGKEKTAVSGFGQIEPSIFDDWEYVDMSQLSDSLDGLGSLGVVAEAGVAAAIASAMPVIGKLIDFMKESGLIGKDVNVKDMMETMTDNPEVQAALTAEQENVLRDEDGDGKPDLPALKTGGYLDTALDFAKSNPLPTALLLGGAAYLIYDTFFTPSQAKGKSSQQGLSGVGRKRKKNTSKKLKAMELI